KNASRRAWTIIWPSRSRPTSSPPRSMPGWRKAKRPCAPDRAYSAARRSFIQRPDEALFGGLTAGTKTSLDIVGQQLLAVIGDRRSAQRHRLFAVDEHGRCRGFAGSGERDADIGMLGFAGAVDDAAHHRDLQLFDPR